MMRLCIDIDGIIGKKIKWEVGESYMRAKDTFLNIDVDEKVIEKINSLYDKGYKIILHTSRIWHDFDVTREWLKKHKVKYHVLIMAKPLADYYLDDRNIGMGDFMKL